MHPHVTSALALDLAADRRQGSLRRRLTESGRRARAKAHRPAPRPLPRTRAA